MEKSATATKKPTKKKWYEIVAPKEIFRQIVLGETLTSNLQGMVGKTIKVNLMNLTNDPKQQSISIRFRVTEVRENRALTQIECYEMSSSQVKRIVRRGKNKIDDSFETKTKDNTKIVIKPLIITRNLTQKSVQTAIRHKIREHLKQLADKSQYTELLEGIITTRVQRELREQLKKIYPIQSCEIRMLEKLA